MRRSIHRFVTPFSAVIVLLAGLPVNVPAEELEEDMLDKAWGLEPASRLSCQAIIKDRDLVIEIPKYTINLASESH